MKNQQTYPQNVNGMILRGIFTATKREIDHFYHGGTALYFPENYQRLTALVEEPGKPNLPAQLLEKLQKIEEAGFTIVAMNENCFFWIEPFCCCHFSTH